MFTHIRKLIIAFPSSILDYLETNFLGVGFSLWFGWSLYRRLPNFSFLLQCRFFPILASESCLAPSKTTQYQFLFTSDNLYMFNHINLITANILFYLYGLCVTRASTQLLTGVVLFYSATTCSSPRAIFGWYNFEDNWNCVLFINRLLFQRILVT
jgi:hypothetical protein